MTSFATELAPPTVTDVQYLRMYVRTDIVPPKLLMKFQQGRPNAGVKYKRDRKIGDFRPISRYISDTITRCSNVAPYVSVPLAAMDDMIQVFKILIGKYDATLSIIGSP